MRVGVFNRLANLERLFETGQEDSLGQPITEWRRINTFWCEKSHKSEDEAFSASQRYAVRTVTFRAHFLADIKETDRLEVDGLFYDIKGIREVGFREGTEIAAEWQN